MTARLSPQREAEIRAWLGRLGERANPDWHGPYSAMQDVLNELAAVRAELARERQNFEAYRIGAEGANKILSDRLHDAAMTRTWRNEDGKKFVFVEDIAPALLGTAKKEATS